MPTPIGFLRHNFLARSETFIYSSMKGIEDAGIYNVRVFALKRLLPERFPWDDVTLPGGFARHLYRATRYAPSFSRWANSVQLIHAHLGQTGPFAMAGAARAGVPFVVSYYGHDVVMYKNRERFESWAWWYTLTRKNMLARAAKVIVLSEHMRRALEAQGCPADKIAVVRLGVDLARFDVAHVPATGPLRILMVGREVDKKGFDDGLRACRAARRSRCRRARDAARYARSSRSLAARARRRAGAAGIVAGSGISGPDGDGRGGRRARAAAARPPTVTKKAHRR